MAYTSNYGAAPTYVKLASYTAPNAVSSYTFSNIPQGYTDLVLVASVIRTASSDIYVQVGNGSVDTTASNYSGTYVYGNGTSAGSGRWTSANNLFWDIGYSSSTNPATSVANFMNYSSSVMYKTLVVRNSAAAADVSAWAELWRSTAPINTIKVYPTSGNFDTGTTLTIYGIKAALTPKATGGDIVVNDGVYWYHTFRTSGAFVPKSALTADYLVVAGGGGGGGYAYTGGGGAGGLRCTVTATGGGGSLESALSLTGNTSYTVTVGAGGAGGSSTVPANYTGSNGSNSVFATITSTGGGGGSGYNTAGTTGGSGGGATSVNAIVTTGYAGTANQGYKGGDSNIVSGGGASGGGGGGAGAAGANATTTASGNGGAGVATSISGTSVTYAGGGGGGGSNSPNCSAGSGGSGGGGAGASSAANGTSGTAGLGGGGGGGWWTPAFVGGNGGSGIVVVRYPV